MTLASLELLSKPVYQIFSKFTSIVSIPRAKVAAFHTTACNLDLSEFFEDQKNWGKQEIRSGRSWKLDELRIKSNEDLHKLWYILLKEKNMLLTMELFYKDRYILFPSPERIDKVEDSMKNLETVVRERNKAYYMLETGKDGEQPGYTFHTAIGLPCFRKATQHFIPKYMNTWFKKNFFPGFDYKECREFLKLYMEKMSVQNRGLRRVDNIYVRGLLRRFKNIDKEALQRDFPKSRVEVYAKSDSCRGHWQPR